MIIKRNSYVRRILVLLAIILTVVINASTTFGQKKKKSKKKNAELQEQFSDRNADKADIEHLFVEAEKYYIIRDFEESLELFLKVLELDPNNAAANFKAAEILSQGKENTKALAYAQQAVDNGKDNKYYYLLLANIYTNLGELKKSIAVFKQLTENIPNTQQYLFNMAALQLYDQDFESALNTYDQIKEFFGPMEPVTVQKQQIYLKQNQLDLAIKEGKDLIAAFPGQSQYIVSLAQLLISNDKLDEAKALLSNSMESMEDVETSGVLLAEIYRKSGDIKKALEVLGPAFESKSMEVNAKVRTLAGYMAMLPNEELNEPMINLATKLLKTHPDSYHGYAIAGDLYFNAGNKESARSNYLKAIELEASNYNIWQNIISIDIDLNLYEDAIRHSELALEHFPNQAALYYFNGTAHLMKKNYESAIKTLNAGKPYTNHDPNLKSIFNGQLGDAYNSMGDHAKSDAAYEEALKAKPDNDHVLNNYSYFLSLRKEKLDKALKMSKKLIDNHPDNPTYLDTYAWVLYMNGDFEEAKIHLKKAIEDVNVSATIIEHYGDVLFKLGDVNGAVEQWKKAKSMSSDSEMLDKKIADRQLYE